MAVDPHGDFRLPSLATGVGATKIELSRRAIEEQIWRRLSEIGFDPAIRRRVDH